MYINKKLAEDNKEQWDLKIKCLAKPRTLVGARQCFLVQYCSCGRAEHMHHVVPSTLNEFLKQMTYLWNLFGETPLNLTFPMTIFEVQVPAFTK